MLRYLQKLPISALTRISSSVFGRGGGGGVEGEVEVSAGSFPKSAAGNRDQGPVVRKPINLTL